MIICDNDEYFKPGDKVVSLVDHSPIIRVGTVGTIVNRWVGPYTQLSYQMDNSTSG